MSHFSGHDLVFYQEDGKIMSGGYLIDSILLKQGISPMTTLNQSGGINTNNKVSNIFENLAVPAGLMYTYKKGSSIDDNSQKGGLNQNKNTNKNTNIDLSDEIHDELFKHIEVNLNKRNTNKKTKKQKGKSNKQSKKIIK